MNDQTNSVVGAAASTAAATATKFTYGYVVGGSLIGVIGKIDWAVVFSILIGIATFLTNLYFKKRDDKRKDEIHELQTKQYELTKKRLEGGSDDKRTDQSLSGFCTCGVNVRTGYCFIFCEYAT